MVDKSLTIKAVGCRIRHLRQAGEYRKAISYCEETLNMLNVKDYMLRQFLHIQLTALYAQTGDILCLSVRTITNHQQRIYSKLGVNSSTEMVRETREMGLI